MYFDKIINFFTVERLINYSGKLVSIIITLIASKFVIKLGNRFIKKWMTKDVKKVKTLKLLLKSVLRYGIYFFAILIILSILNVPIGSLIAGAGILGVAIGFGAQNLVKDIINGFFILFEEQFGVGDYVEIEDVSGIVEEIGLRTTKIRDFGGQLHILPNSKIEQVTNHSDGNMRVMVDVGVSYDENIQRVIDVLEELCQQIAEEKNDIITEGPRVLGVQELTSSSIVIRLWARVKPMEQWGMARYIRKRAKERLNEREIEIPYPHLVLLDKKGVLKNEG